MAVQPSALQVNPPRNTIGGPLPEHPLTYATPSNTKSPLTLNVARPLPPTMKVVNPETGEVEEHLRFNARDLINIQKWKEYREPVAEVVNEVDEVRVVTTDNLMPTSVGHDVIDPELRAADPALTALDELRAQVEAKGIEVDGRWGTKKLREMLGQG